MLNFDVRYQNTIDAADPLKAVKEVIRGIKNKEALMFTVRDTNTGECFSVDMNGNEGDEVVPIREESFFND